MAERRMRVGVIGAGWVARARHVPSLQLVDGVEIVGVVDHDQARARSLADAAGASFAGTSLDALLDLGLDAVTIATSPWSHAELATASLGAGLHVFCEKPMAMHSEEARLMRSAANDANRVLCISHNFLFSNSVQRADQLFADDSPNYVIGMQQSSHARRLPTWYASLPGGLMFDEMPHLLYMLNHFMGGPLRLDHARSSQEGSTVELLLSGQRASGSIVMCFDTPISEWHVGIVSPSRAVSVDLFRDIVTPLRSDGAHRAPDIARTSAQVVWSQVRGYATTGMRLARRRQFWGHDALLRQFVDAARIDGPSPVPVDDALSIVELTDDVLDALSLRA